MGGIDEMSYKIAEIHGDVKHLRKGFDKHVEKHEKLEERVKKQEDLIYRGKYFIFGLSAASVAVVNGLVHLIKAIF
jgi:hypothetical protein